MTNKQELPNYQSIIARLETKIDLLESELSYINGLLTQSGFLEGIKTLKETIMELLSETNNTLIDQENPKLDHL